MKEIKTTTTPLGHELQYYQEWEKSGGSIWMVNAKTIERYIELTVSIYRFEGGLLAFLHHERNVRKQMLAECDPQEVYFYEYNNHECMYSGDGDNEAIKLIVDYWGKDVAKSIVRFSAFPEIGNDENLAV